jgi:antitoxin component of MazEF toxin-antitoxin module
MTMVIQLKDMNIVKSGNSHVVIIPKQFIKHGAIDTSLKYNLELTPLD